MTAITLLMFLISKDGPLFSNLCKNASCLPYSQNNSLPLRDKNHIFHKDSEGMFGCESVSHISSSIYLIVIFLLYNPHASYQNTLEFSIKNDWHKKYYWLPFTFLLSYC